MLPQLINPTLKQNNIICNICVYQTPCYNHEALLRTNDKAQCLQKVLLKYKNAKSSPSPIVVYALLYIYIVLVLDKGKTAAFSCCMVFLPIHSCLLVEVQCLRLTIFFWSQNKICSRHFLLFDHHYSYYYFLFIFSK